MAKSSSSFPLSSEYRYLRISASPRITDALSLRKLLADAMMQSFGLSRAGTYMDVLWIKEEGTEAVVRVAEADAQTVLAAVVVLDKPVRLSVVKHSNFLPTLLGDGESWMQADAEE
ncbi:hypothetical protein M422DRAFT_172777 [Sphaerobolus stellatus SS14]|uniref:Ribonucleases P/MRP subunit Pop8-like domain-containing protein n=1 Tax=Sphaerobolus stellatus (strain SS14) TaxID=990650 RepID=A0A0C9UDE1_SPHS4|nr:hypothetical protein M422DRAFT_172777 [Sphaerobolus stellatus SS14]